MASENAAGKADIWAPLTRHSAFAARCLRLWPERCQALLDEQRLQSAGVATPALPENLSLAELDQWLRGYRQSEALRICWRDVCLKVEQQTTLTELSSLAEHCLQASLHWHTGNFVRRFGHLQDEHGQSFGFSILALGKLGGEELNFSSDIDIMFVHNAVGRSSGPRRLYADDYVNRLGQALSNSLHKVLASGRVYRVDTRLRPFGDSGALVWSRPAMEQYYVQQGRDWERYALQKARVVAGDKRLGQNLLDELQPFIYRRYLDYGLFEGIRGMRADITRQAERLGQRDHLKLGAGGIREIEFVVQSLQLLRGGQQPAVRHHNLLGSLHKLQQHGYLQACAAQHLRAAYCYLRRLENRLQMRDDRQLHQLPVSADERQAFAHFCGHDDWQSLYASLNQHRQQVSRLFLQHFGQRMQTQPHTLAHTGTALTAAAFANAQLLQQKLQLPVTAVPDYMAAISATVHQIERKLVDATAHQRWQQLAPLILLDAGQTANPASACSNALEIISALARRSNYLALLLEMPGARKRMLELCANGGYLVRCLQSNPVLLDDLVDPQLLGNLASSVDELLQRMQSGIDAVSEPEQQLLQLQHWRQSYQFRVAGNELLGQIDSLQARQQLSWLAESIIRISLDCCRQQRPQAPELAVLAYGSLGAAEMHYESDLDLVFIYADKDRELEYAATRLVQKLIHWLTSLGSSQRLYRIDTRLRPNGRSGTLVTSLSAFKHYQQQQAWVWEWQALSRARCLARISHHPAIATAPWHALTGVRSVGVLDVASTTPARSSVANDSHAAPWNRLPTNYAEKCGPGGAKQLLDAFAAIRHNIIAPAANEEMVHQAMLEMYRRMVDEQRLAAGSNELARLRIQFLTQFWLLTTAIDSDAITCYVIPQNCLQQLQLLARGHTRAAGQCAAIMPIWMALIQAQNLAQLNLKQPAPEVPGSKRIDEIWRTVFPEPA